MSYFKHDKALVADGAQIGAETRIWAFSNVLDGAIIGKGCNICDGCFIEKGGVLGNHVTLKNGVAIFDGVALEDDVFVGAHTVFINDRLPRSNRDDEWILEKTVVKKGATIGANSTVLCGLTIGEYAFIGAGTVVTKDVQPYTVVIGNPGKMVGYITKEGVRLDENLKSNDGTQYEMTDQGPISS